jgi:DNA-binding beta-propeller fold protein YncE
MERQHRISLSLVVGLLAATAVFPGGGGAGASTAQTSLYVTDVTDGTLVHVDPSGPTVGPGISVGQAPIDVAITDDGDTAYVARGFSNVVVPVDLATSTPSVAIPVACPGNIALVPGGAKAYVTQPCGTTIVPVDLATGTAGTPIELGVPPYDVAVTADGDTAWVTTRPPPDGLGTDTALIPVDVDTDVAGTPVPLGLEGQSASIVLGADDASAFVAMDTDGVVVPVDLGTRTARSPIDVSPHPAGAPPHHSKGRRCCEGGAPSAPCGRPSASTWATAGGSGPGPAAAPALRGSAGPGG